MDCGLVADWERGGIPGDVLIAGESGAGQGAVSGWGGRRR